MKNKNRFFTIGNINSNYTKARFHITFITQISKSMVKFIGRRNIKLDVPNANPCTNFDVKDLRVLRFHWKVYKKVY